MRANSHKIIREKHLREEKLGGISKSTFNRRYRHHPDAPQPVDTPDGMLAWWEHEWDEFLTNLGRTDDPKANVSPPPEHWRGNPRGNLHQDDKPVSAQVA